MNLTPHPLDIRAIGGSLITMPVHGPAARVVTHNRNAGTVAIDGVVIRITVTPSGGTVVNLPQPQPGRQLIVSRVVAEACPDRHDLLFPDELLRDGDGNVIRCAALSRLEHRQ